MIQQTLPNARLREVEVSITARCSLACADCGFLVPHQPAPSIGEVVAELTESLQRLKTAGITIGSLAILGGEPTLNQQLLERSVLQFRHVGIADRLEVVSNGLTPQGLSIAALGAIDRLTISVYGYSNDFIEAWQNWLSRTAPAVELVLRRSDGGWDPWTAEQVVTADEAQAMYDNCWYRKHCITVERGRLFTCSRIPKLGHDEQGLELIEGITAEAVLGYLRRPLSLPDCASCTPMMGLPTVPAGIQPDDRIDRLQRRAFRWLQGDAANFAIVGRR